MSLTREIIKYYSTITFCKIIPQKTGTSYLYQYESAILNYIIPYFKKHYPTNWKATFGNKKIRFYQKYENGFNYLCCSFHIYNKKNKHEIINIDNI